jgi:hypothetical protein
MTGTALLFLVLGLGLLIYLLAIGKPLALRRFETVEVSVDLLVGHGVHARDGLISPDRHGAVFQPLCGLGFPKGVHHLLRVDVTAPARL